MEKWLVNANDILEGCAGIGTEQETRQKMDSINVIRTYCLHSITTFFYSHSQDITPHEE